jgi:hypothetical protein
MNKIISVINYKDFSCSDLLLKSTLIDINPYYKKVQKNCIELHRKHEVGEIPYNLFIPAANYISTLDLVKFVDSSLEHKPFFFHPDVVLSVDYLELLAKNLNTDEDIEIGKCVYYDTEKLERKEMSFGFLLDKKRRYEIFKVFTSIISSGFYRTYNTEVCQHCINWELCFKIGVGVETINKYVPNEKEGDYINVDGFKKNMPKSEKLLIKV